MENDPESDRIEIRAVITEYNVGGDLRSVSRLASTFAPDGVLVTPGFGDGPVSYTGPKEIRAKLRSARKGRTGVDRPMQLSRHHQTTCEITVESPEQASAVTYFLHISEIGLDHSGVYIDKFRKIDGVWKIAHRKVRIDWVAENGHSRLTRPGQ
ncbi:MAG: nuclear transport factor 2 family protein [Roseovarius sp.]|nr:nuclear transport factor 2 family protein [Roseovarius sp.]